MKPREIRELTDGELREKISDQAEELANIKFQKALHQLDNTSKIRITRRELARLMTIESERKKTPAGEMAISDGKENR